MAVELDLARAAMETVVRQLATVTKNNQVGMYCSVKSVVFKGASAYVMFVSDA